MVSLSDGTWLVVDQSTPAKGGHNSKIRVSFDLASGDNFVGSTCEFESVLYLFTYLEKLYLLLKVML